MIGIKRRSICMDDLVKEIRQEAARTRLRAPRWHVSYPSGKASAGVLLDWGRFGSHIDSAVRDAYIGAAAPGGTSVRSLFRPLARLAARIILASARFITVPQQQFNFAVLHSLNTLADGFGNLERKLREKGLAEPQVIVGPLEDIAELKARVGQLEETVSRLVGPPSPHSC
jgi:hypothetical protein